MNQPTPRNPAKRRANLARRAMAAVVRDESAAPDRPRWIGFLASLAVVIGTIAWVGAALFPASDAWGREDWDYFAQHYAACRISILDYQQFPWWNPWNCGGMPLAANPQIGVYSPTMALCLLFDVWTGLRVSLWGHLFLAGVGAHALLWRTFRSPAASAVAGVVYSLNGAAIFHAAAGHLGIQSAAYLPWVILFLAKCRGDARWGLAAGVALAAAVHVSLHYVTVLSVLIVSVLGLGWAAAGERIESRRILAGLVLGAAAVLAICGQRILLAGQLVAENPRTPADIFRVAIQPATLARSLASWGQRMEDRLPHSTLDWHECGAYAGALTVVLFAASLFAGWRWWHSLFFFCLAFWIGNQRWYHPSGWLESLPVFSMMRVPTRWRAPAMLGLAMGAGQAIRSLDRGRSRWMGLLISAAAIGDIALQARLTLEQAFVIQPRQSPGPVLRGGIEQFDGQAAPPQCRSFLYFLTIAGRGVIRGYEPLVAMGQEPRGAVGRGDPRYQGEFGPAGLVRQALWSPNRIVLEGPPGTRAWINQNLGSYWCIRGEPIAAVAEVVDRSQRVEATIDPTGRIDLSLQPPRSWLGRSLQLAAAVFTIGLFAWLGRRTHGTDPARRPAGGG